MQQAKIPFGMLFEEQAPQSSKSILIPEYDPIESISFIIDSYGNRVPYIQEQWITLETQTATFVKAEASDSDQESSSLGTETATKVRAEGSDDDKHRFDLGTQTETRVKAEPSDSDQENRYIFAATQTITEVRAETTDTD